MYHKRALDIKVFLAIKNTNINNGPIFRRIKANHKDRYLHHLHVQKVSSPEIFEDLNSPAKFVRGNNENTGGFVYFMAHELTNEQFDEAIKTGHTFGVIQIDKEAGYITTCYNRIEAKTNNAAKETTRTTVGTPT